MRADDAWRAELAATNIGDLVIGVLHDASPAAIEKGARWLHDTVR
jgi:hypothetical protein